MSRGQPGDEIGCCSIVASHPTAGAPTDDESAVSTSSGVARTPNGIVEQAGDKLGFVKRRTVGDLERFKGFIEERGRETGGWRGDVS